MGVNRLLSTHAFSELREAVLVVLRAQIEYVELRLKTSRNQLVHGNIFAVELNATHLQQMKYNVKN